MCAAAESFGLYDSAAGWVATTYLAGSGISSVSAVLWLHRLGRKTLALTLFFTAACLLMLASTMQAYTAVVGTQYWVYALAINLFFFVWLFALPHFISVVAGADKSGRATSLVTACLAFGSMLGPAVAGELIAFGGFPLLYLSGAVCSCVAYACAVAMARK